MNAARLQELRTSPGSSQVVTRENSPIVTTAIAVEPAPADPPIVRRVTVIPIRGGSADAKAAFLKGDPILQLERSRNPAPRQVTARWTRNKNGDFEAFTQNLDIVKTHIERRSQRRNIIEQVHEVAIINAGSRALLGEGLNGHAVYAAPRYKPAVPDGRSDIPATTGKMGYTGSYLLTTAPVGTEERLANESYIANNAPSLSQDQIDQVFSRPDRVTVPTGNFEPATYNFEVAEDKGTPAPSTGNGGKMVFLVAAVFVAWLVLR